MSLTSGEVCEAKTCQGRLADAGCLKTHSDVFKLVWIGDVAALLSLKAASFRICPSCCSAFLFFDLFAFWVDVRGGSPWTLIR